MRQVVQKAPGCMATVQVQDVGEAIPAASAYSVVIGQEKVGPEPSMFIKGYSSGVCSQNMEVEALDLGVVGRCNMRYQVF